MHISLIGMSNIGKTACSRHLAADYGYQHIDCDALIESKLANEPTFGSGKGIEGVAEWMGFPSSPQYKTNSGIYLANERAVMHEAFDLLAKNKDMPVIFDTTGSVVYTGDDVLIKLRAVTRVVYLEASEEHTQALFKTFMGRPKPVIWGDCYAPLADESRAQTLAKCYPELLRTRAQRYKEIAHITIPFTELISHKGKVSALILEKVSA